MLSSIPRNTAHRHTLMSIEIVRYDSSMKDVWDRFIGASKNGVFLFNRGYMDYHADRFTDHSLIFFDDNEPVAVLPMNKDGSAFVSHGGLTFGGIVSNHRMRTAKMLEIVGLLKTYLRQQGGEALIYKAIPHIYAVLPSEEDLYALVYHGAVLTRRDVSSTILQKGKVPFSKGRRWLMARARKNGLRVYKTNDYETFMSIEERNLLTRHGVKPVHSAREITLLAETFPDNIKLFGSFREETMLGGVIVYESPNVAHTQYIAVTDEGREIGASDIIIDYLVSEYYHDKPYFDFGISTEDQGRFLNKGLIEFKEGFGARATVYDFYTLPLH